MNLKSIPKKTILIGTLALSFLFGATTAFAIEENSGTIDPTSPDVQQELAQDLKNIENLKNKDKKAEEKERKQALKVLKETNPEKYAAVTGSEMKAMTVGSMGTIGDILITYDNETLGWNHGHAAIVRDNLNYIVEAWPNAGVRNYANNWAVRWSSHKAFWVSGATYSNYANAQDYAYSKINYPYDILADKSNPFRFYCSSLVWQSWATQGFGLDANGGTYVTPADIENHSKTIGYSYNN